MSGSAQMSKTLARTVGTSLLEAYGAPSEHATVVVEHLLDAEVSGVKSHGLIRLPEYVRLITDGFIDPSAVPKARGVHETMVAIDGCRGFGQLAVSYAVSEVQAIALEHGTGIATVRNTGHAGRMGAYAEELGRSGHLSIVACTSPIGGHFVAPYGGREGRLATNPIAFSIPRRGAPIVGDFSTAALPEGRIRRLRDQGETLPEHVLLDGEGRPTRDPSALYRDRRAVILPFGGDQGHRGYALGLLVEALATLLAGDLADDGDRIGNNVTLLAMRVDEDFRSRSDEMATYICSAAPAKPGEPVVVPGDPELRARSATKDVTFEEATWVQMLELGKKRGLDWATGTIPGQ